MIEKVYTSSSNIKRHRPLLTSLEEQQIINYYFSNQASRGAGFVGFRPMIEKVYTSAAYLPMSPSPHHVVFISFVGPRTLLDTHREGDCNQGNLHTD